MKLLGLHDILETERCIIKIPEESEAEAMWNLIEDKTTEFMLWDKCEHSEMQKENILERRYQAIKGENWDGAIYLKSGEIIGSFGLPRIFKNSKRGEIGYWLGSKYWGKGYIPEAIEGLKRYVFENLDWESLVIRANTENINSCRVAEKCDFQKDGIIKKEEFCKGRFEDIVYYSFTREDYFSKR